VKTIPSIFLSCVLFGLASATAQTAFRVKVPDLKGKEATAVLMFNDIGKTIQISPAKHVPVIIPYANIDKASYQYTHSAEGKVHWLELDYHEGDDHKEIVVRMNPRNRIKILDALKAHTGIDAEVEGNANKRRK
jgi:hypothetical protein